MKCTSCGSTFVDERRIGMSVGASVGAAAGAYLGVRHINSEDKENDFIGAFGLFAACSLAGAAAGSTLDGTLIDNYQCNKCGHTFKTGLSPAMLTAVEYSDKLSSSTLGAETGITASAAYRSTMAYFADDEGIEVELPEL